MESCEAAPTRFVNAVEISMHRIFVARRRGSRHADRVPLILLARVEAVLRQPIARGDELPQPKRRLT